MKSTCFRIIALASLTLALGRCGLIADKNLIVVAELDGQSITRGELKGALRAMPDDERPNISNRGALERYLREYIDGRIRESLALDLSAEGKIDVPIEVAQQQYFSDHPDQAMLPTLTDPTPLGVTQQQLDALKADVDYEIGVLRDKMLREKAVQYYAGQAVAEGLITISEEELQREYEVQKESFRSLEYIDFIALRFPTNLPNAVTMASDVRRRLDAGESFDTIVDEFLQSNAQFVLASRFENNPSSATFRTFWMTATGAETGEIMGPVFIPAYSLMNSEGQSVKMPDAYLVLRVEDHQPSTPLPFEQAKNLLAQVIAMRKAVELLRDEHGVKFFDDMLWDPGAAGVQEFQI